MTKPCLLITLPVLLSRAGNALDDFETIVANDDEDLGKVIADQGGRVDAVYCVGMEQLDRKRLDQMPKLRLIAVAAAGMDGIDIDHARTRGIVVANADGINADDVADFAMALYLGFRRQLVDNHLYVREGRWGKEWDRPLVPAISCDRVGIVGMGHIGKALAKRLAPFGPEIRWWGPNPKAEVPQERMPTLLALADWATVLFVAVRGEKSTVALIDKDVIAALGGEGLLVNISRGFVVDEAALVDALRNGTLGGAALDVFAKEPFDGASMAGLDNVLLTPHVAGSTTDAFDGVEKLSWRNLQDFAAGKPVASAI